MSSQVPRVLVIDPRVVRPYSRKGKRTRVLCPWMAPEGVALGSTELALHP